MMGAALWSDGRVVAPMMRETPVALRCLRCGAVFLRRDAVVLGELEPWWWRQPEYATLTLVRSPASCRISVIRAVRSHFPLSLAAATSAVDDAPTVLATKAPRVFAMNAGSALSLAGAVVACETDGSTTVEPTPPAEWVAAPEAEEPAEDELIQLAATVRTPQDERLLRLLAWRVGNDRFRTEDTLWLPYDRRPVSKQNLETLLLRFGDEDGDVLLRGEALRQLGRFEAAATVLAHPGLLDRPGTKELLALAAQRIDRVSVVAVAG